MTLVGFRKTGEVEADSRALLVYSGHTQSRHEQENSFTFSDSYCLHSTKDLRVGQTVVCYFTDQTNTPPRMALLTSIIST